MPGRARGAVLAALCCALSVSLVAVESGVPAAADPKDTLSQRIEQAGEAVDRANAKVTRALRVLGRAESRLPLARARLLKARKASAEARTEAASAVAASKAADAAVAQVQADRDRVRTQLDSLQGDMGDVARLVYQQGPYAQLELILGAQSPGDFVGRLAAVDAVGRSQSATQRRLFTVRADLAQREARLQALKSRADTERQRAVDAFAVADAARIDAVDAARSVFSLVDKRKRALRVARKNASAVKARYAKLRRAQASVSRVSASASGEGNGDAPSGELKWPLPGGSIAAMPGPRTHPVYGYRSCHTGLDIDGNTGDAILAADDGTVVAITNGGPYGLATLISHGDGLATFYAHQSSVKVSEGDRVRKGEVIGAVGTSGWVTGSHLHFEVHVGGKPYNPMGWFGGSRSPVDC